MPDIIFYSIVEKYEDILYTAGDLKWANGMKDRMWTDGVYLGSLYIGYAYLEHDLHPGPLETALHLALLLPHKVVELHQVLFDLTLTRLNLAPTTLQKNRLEYLFPSTTDYTLLLHWL